MDSGHREQHQHEEILQNLNAANGSLPVLQNSNSADFPIVKVEQEQTDDLENAIGAALGLLGFLTQQPSKEGSGDGDMDVDAQLAQVVGDVCLSLESQIDNEPVEDATVREESAGKEDLEHELKEENPEFADDVAPLNASTGTEEPSGETGDAQESQAEAAIERQTVDDDGRKQDQTSEDIQAETAAEDDEFALAFAEIAQKVSEDHAQVGKAPDLAELESHSNHAVNENDDRGPETAGPNDDTNVDLESAINDVFKNLSSAIGMEATAGTSQELTEPQLQEALRSTEMSAEPQQSENTSKPSENDEDHNEIEADTSTEINLEDVIGQAFKSIINTSEGGTTTEPLSAQKQAETEPSQAPKTGIQDVAFDLEGIVNNVVQQMARENAKASSESTSPDPGRLTEPSSSTGESSGHHMVPTLAENVLQHFQLNTSLQVLHSEASKNTSLPEHSNDSASAHSAQDTNDRESELEKLQMNEILQNAFNMAMLNPQELLASEIDDHQNQTESGSSHASTAAAIAALSASTATSARRTSSVLEKSNKPMSIAETLALHRSTMANENREALDLQSLRANLQNDGSSPIHPQLSNILSSLSLHIQSGTQSQNLMLVIRQMTNSLMLNKNFTLNVNTAVLKLLMEVSSSPEEKAFVVDSLKRTKQLLGRRSGEEESQRALTLIGNVLYLLNPTAISKSNDGIDIPIDNMNDARTDSFFSHAYSTLASFSSSRLKSALLGVKPDYESEEYKERIRIENRERKKKWREENAERNKDNDLRARVIKRASLMYGDDQLPEKRAWIEEEFARRREKRLSRRKQEESKAESPSMVPRLPSGDNKICSQTMLNDASLVRRITDIYNLVAECGSERDPEAVMSAASAAVAVVATCHTGDNEFVDAKPAQAAMSLILNSILEANVRSGSYKRIPFITKDSNKIGSLRSGQSHMDEKSFSADNAPAFTLVENSKDQKRFDTEFYASEIKRFKLNDQENLQKPGHADVTPLLQYSKQSYLASNSPPVWNSVSGLKMPQYMKQNNNSTALHKQQEPGSVYTKSLPRGTSPFLSNKNSYDPKLGVTGGLKRPGSYQKPAMKTGDKSGKSYSFPTFYSPSFLRQ